MIKLTALKTCFEIVNKKYLWFLEPEDHRIMIECIYNKGPYQLKISEEFSDYKAYSPQFLKIQEKMDIMAKVIDAEADK